MNCSAWKHSVIVSREEEARKYLESHNLNRFTVIEGPLDFAFSMYYGKVYHDTDADRGYVEFYDAVRDRKIFFTTHKVGQSHSFHVEKRIKHVVHLIKSTDILKNNHESHINMTPLLRKRWFINLINVTLQVFEVEGNVTMFCYNGRSRSPMYLVVYLIIIYNMTPDEAMDTVRNLLSSQRDQPMDRHDTLTPLVEDIYLRKFKDYAA